MADDHHSLGRLPRRAHGRRAGLDDRSLFACDLRDGIAQHLHVVERDRGDHADLGGPDHIGRVAPAAKPGFEHDNIALLFDEIQKSKRSRELKRADRLTRRQLYAFARNRHPLGKAGQVGVRDHHAVHPDALIKLHEIGRGVQPHAQPRRAQRGRDHARGRALAVCARQMDELQPVLRIAQRRAQRTDAVQPGLARKAAEGMDIIDCGFGKFGVHNKPFPVMR